MIQIKKGADVDIGANPSAEEADEGLEDGVETVNNVAYSFRLTSTSFDKKSYMTYIKGYMKKLKVKLQESNPDRVTIFEKGAATLVKKILETFKVCFGIFISISSFLGHGEIHSSFDVFLNHVLLKSLQDYEFYIGESMDPESMVALLNYREDGITPYFTFFKDGLKVEKLVSFTYLGIGIGTVE